MALWKGRCPAGSGRVPLGSRMRGRETRRSHVSNTIRQLSSLLTADGTHRRCTIIDDRAPPSKFFLETVAEGRLASSSESADSRSSHGGDTCCACSCSARRGLLHLGCIIIRCVLHIALPATDVVALIKTLAATTQDAVQVDVVVGSVSVWLIHPSWPAGGGDDVASRF
jgi:hypothetical protein